MGAKPSCSGPGDSAGEQESSDNWNSQKRQVQTGYGQVREEGRLQEAGRQLQEACDSLLQECNQESPR